MDSMQAGIGKSRAFVTYSMRFHFLPVIYKRNRMKQLVAAAAAVRILGTNVSISLCISGGVYVVDNVVNRLAGCCWSFD